MFKRVEKRLKKKRDEEELGLDEDMKDVLGLQDTDSDESESESDSESDSGESSNDGKDSDNGELHDTGETQGRKRKHGTMDDGDEDEADDEADELGESSGEDDHEDAKKPTITVQEALKDPLYIISLQPNVKGCIVCPGKLLKNVRMYSVHKASKAHGRRFKLFTEITAKVEPDENAWDILQHGVAAQTDRASPKPAEQVSKRAEKRKAKAAAIKAKREKQKAMKAKAIAKKAVKAVSPAVDPSPSKTAERTRKKRKMAPVTEDVSQMIAEKPPPAVAPVETPKKIKQHLAQGTTEKRKPVGSQPEHLKQKKIKARHLEGMRTPKNVEKPSKLKVKSKPHRTKGKV